MVEKFRTNLDKQSVAQGRSGRKHYSPVMLLCLGIILLLLGGVAGFRYHAYLFPEAADGLQVVAAGEAADLAESQIAVHVIGAVANPGLYWLDSGARVQDALDAAGVRDEADLSALNLAAILHDGLQLEVPQQVDSSPSGLSGLNADLTAAGADNSSVVAPPPAENSGKININTASESELQALNGIGPVKAAAIVAYREANGAFTDIAQINNVSGIGPATYEKIKDQICVE